MTSDICRLAGSPQEAAAALSLLLADAALRAIRHHHLGASPANYSFWYAYADGSNVALTKAVDDVVAVQARFAQADLDRLAQVYMPDKSKELASAGDGMGTQIAHVLRLLVGALDASSAYGASLSGALSHLGGAKDAASIAALVQTVVLATAKEAQNNRSLTERLNVSLKEIHDLRCGLETIRTESQRDGLTGLFNRKYFAAAIDRLVAHARQSGGRLSLLVLDIDFFKSFNDTHGHLSGDQVLRLVAQTISRCIEGAEVAVRYGGEEFIVLLPDSDLDIACVRAETIRTGVAAGKLRRKSTDESLGRVTISIGAAELLDDDSCESLIERADDCLYQAKHSGRDCVVRQRIAAPALRRSV